MTLGKEAIEELKTIYRQEYGDELSEGEAQEMAQRLISLFRVIYRPLSESKGQGQDEEPEPPGGA